MNSSPFQSKFLKNSAVIYKEFRSPKLKHHKATISTFPLISICCFQIFFKIRISQFFKNSDWNQNNSIRKIPYSILQFPLKPKSLQRSRAVGDFYGTGIQIWADIFHVFMGKKKNLKTLQTVKTFLAQNEVKKKYFFS